MKVLQKMWKEEEGVLTFEWILLITLLTIGIVGGVAAVRDALIDELSDVAEAMLSLDQSFRIDFPLHVDVHAVSTSGASDSQFVDNFGFNHCERANVTPDQGTVINCDFGTLTPGNTAP